LKTPTTDDKRSEIAAVCRANLGLTLSMALNAIDNDVEEKYISIPKRLYLVDRNGFTAYTGALSVFCPVARLVSSNSPARNSLINPCPTGCGGQPIRRTGIGGQTLRGAYGNDQRCR
jgi:hypothetical protein